MYDIDSISLCPEAKIRQAMEELNQSRVRIVLIVDSGKKLIGTCTDGDIRRALLKGAVLDDPVSVAMNANPMVALDSESQSSILERMRRDSILSMPIVNLGNVVQGLVILADPRRERVEDVPIVLMLGGLGSRLRPLTDDCPKPMLEVGGEPILKRIINKFKDQGFRNFYFSINYLGHVIENYFGNGDRFDVSITYLREKKKLGTGGALSLLQNNISTPFIVMNGDLLTDLDFRSLVEEHKQMGHCATMCVREHLMSVPFGVVNFQGKSYINTQEKPTYTHYINAGIYCLSSEVVSFVPKDQFYDMPSLFADLTQSDLKCGVYEMHDSWYDIGTHEEFTRAQKLFASS